MKITTDKEYYKALLEREELYEISFNFSVVPSDPKELEKYTTHVGNLQELNAAIRDWDAEQNKEDIQELGERDWIEVTDRADTIIQVVDILLEHPAISQTPALKEKVEHAQGILFEVYQACSNNY